MPKTFRLLLWIAMTLGLVAGQALPVIACGNAETQTVCGKCCGMAGAACCEKSPVPAHSTPPKIVVSSVDLKQVVVPVLICLGTPSRLSIPSISVQKSAHAQQPVQRRLDVTCIRLI